MSSICKYVSKWSDMKNNKCNKYSKSLNVTHVTVMIKVNDLTHYEKKKEKIYFWALVLK